MKHTIGLLLLLILASPAASAQSLEPKTFSDGFPAASSPEWKNWNLATLFRLEKRDAYRRFGESRSFFDQDAPRIYAVAFGYRPRPDLHTFMDMSLKVNRTSSASAKTSIGFGVGMDWFPVSTGLFELGPTARFGMGMSGNSAQPTLGLTTTTYLIGRAGLVAAYRIGESTSLLELGLRVGL